MSALLELDHVSRRLGGLLAVHNLSFGICNDEVFGFIQPNGAGKTTPFTPIGGVE